MNSEIITEEDFEALSDTDMEEILDGLLEEADEEGISPDDLLNYIEFTDDDEDQLVEDFIAEVFGRIKKSASAARAKARKYMQKWLKGSAGKMYKKNQSKRRQKIKKGSIKVDKNLSKNRKQWAKLYNSVEVEGEELMEDNILDISEYLDEASIEVLIENELIDEDGYLDPIIDSLFDDEGDVLTEDYIDFINEFNEQLSEEEDFDSIISIEEAEELHEVLKKIGRGIKKAGKHVWKHKKKYAAGAALAAAGVAANKRYGLKDAAKARIQTARANRIMKRHENDKSLSADQFKKDMEKVDKLDKSAIKAKERRGDKAGKFQKDVEAVKGKATDAAAAVSDKASDIKGAVSDKASSVRNTIGRKLKAAKKGGKQVLSVGTDGSTKKKSLRSRIGGALRGLASSFDVETLNVDGHMTAMFEGEEFSQDFIDRAATIFKAAVGQEMQVQLQQLDEEVESYIETVEEQLAEEMTDNVDKYLNYVSEQWMEENQVAVEQQLRTELAEDFIVGLKGLFDAHYIDVPESKVDLVDALQEKVEMLEDKLTDVVNENLKLSEGIQQVSKETAIDELSSDLNLEEKKKFKELAQSVEVDEDLVENMLTIKESYFGPTASHSEDNEPMDLSEGSMAAYAAVLDRTLKSN